MRLWQLLSASLQAGDERFKAELGWVVNLDMWDEAKQLAAQALKGATSQLSSVTGQEHVRQAGLESLEMQVRCAALRCAALRCAVLCCAVLRCAVLCCAVPDPSPAEACPLRASRLPCAGLHALGPCV